MNALIKFILFIPAAFFITINSISQSYIPPKSEKINDEIYRKGKYMLENAYEQMKRDGKVLAHDYWNIATAYVTLEQSEDTVYNLLVKAKTINSSDFCMIATGVNKLKGGVEFTYFYKYLGEIYKLLITDCMYEEVKIDPLQYANSNGYNVELILKLDSLKTYDMKFRLGKFNPELQRPLDERNIREVEKIMTKFGYPGRSLVGQEYESIAWLVIQHAELEYQEKYLPVIHKAVVFSQLDETPLKMLIDRVYHKKTGKQIFGSQAGVDYADEETIKNVKSKYNLK
jgi:hypothetical protein